MAEFKVTAQARLRKQHDQEFTQYWVAGKCWSAVRETTHILTDNQLDALKKEEEEGMPIKLISVEPIGAIELPIPVPQPLNKLPETPVIAPPWAQSK